MSARSKNTSSKFIVLHRLVKCKAENRVPRLEGTMISLADIFCVATFTFKSRKVVISTESVERAKAILYVYFDLKMDRKDSKGRYKKELSRMPNDKIKSSRVSFLEP